MKLFDTVRLLLTTALTDREVAHAVGSSKPTVNRARRRLRELGRSWDGDLADLSPKEFKRALGFANRGPRRKRLPNFADIERTLGDRKRNRMITRQLLWEEYRGEDPSNALSYSQFAALCRAYAKKKPLTMRQEHAPGERVFVDFSGKRPGYVVPETGEFVPVELFVAVMGASSYTYATCSPSQTIPDWIAVNVAAMNFFGGSPLIAVPDNLKAGVVKPAASGREATFTRAYLDFARHYNLAILPARSRRPKDKAKVEVGVKLIQRWILARLRERTFFSLADLNRAVAALLEDFNSRPMRHYAKLSRRQRFEQLDRPALRALPERPHVYTEWVGSQLVPPDYHVGARGHFYSLPHRLVGEQVEARITDTEVCFFHDNRLVAKHPRAVELGGHTTQREHCPPAHQAMADRTPERMRAWALRVGPNTLAVVEAQLNRTVPEQGLPACTTLQRLADKHGHAVLESAARYGIAMKAATPTNIKTFLRTGVHTTHRPPAAARKVDAHARGPSYYQREAPC